MPLTTITTVAPGVDIGLWQMTEAVECNEYSSVARQREYTCVRLLLDAMYAGDTPAIYYEPTGRPRLTNGDRISISHSKDYCCIIISQRHNVAIDIEKVSNRVDAVAERMLRDDEQAPTLTHRLIHWCAKETLYKLFPDDRLQLSDVRVTPFDCDEERRNGTIKVVNIPRSLTLDVHFIVDNDKIITYCYD